MSEPLEEGPCTLRVVIEQLKYHRRTHTEWAEWFELHPDDPRAVAQFGDAAFHRKVETRYTKMIDCLETIMRSGFEPVTL